MSFVRALRITLAGFAILSLAPAAAGAEADKESQVRRGSAFLCSLGEGKTVCIQAPSSETGHACKVVDGEVFCVGTNDHGELGTGNTEWSLRPVKMEGLAGGAIKVATGDNHTCVLLESGQVQCTGDNRFGQLGDGTTVSRTLPVAVIAAQGIADIRIEDTRSCYATQDGQWQCIGEPQ